MAKRAKALHMYHMAREQQAVGHVEHQQRLHAVIGKTLPELRGAQPTQAEGMAEECRIAVHRPSQPRKFPEFHRGRRRACWQPLRDFRPFYLPNAWAMVRA